MTGRDVSVVEAWRRRIADVRVATTTGMLAAVPPKCSQQPISIPAALLDQAKYILPRNWIFRTDRGAHSDEKAGSDTEQVIARHVGRDKQQTPQNYRVLLKYTDSNSMI